MANSIALFKKYIDLLDEVYKVSSKSSVLDIDGTLVQAGANANEIIIPKISMDGLADYSRNGGYVSGDVTLTNETVKFNYDRGRKFQVDAMDNEETVGLAFGRLSGEFIRTKVVPEIDAVRFATYAGITGVDTASANLATGEAVLNAILTANNAMDEAEVPTDGRYLFITPTLHNFMKAVDSYKSKSMVEGFAGIIDVPQSRFYTAVDLLDGTTKTETSDETAGGYVKDKDAKNINFMIIHKPAVIQYSKHVVNKIFTPEQNQNADAWQFCYRAYGLTDAYENKAAGIYVHTEASA
ncbi:MAG: hypothetical protein K2J11_11500 [Oscillospiraceae bacterium]|nr:hypothetical protein [Oscillospiraceae bacterium]